MGIHNLIAQETREAVWLTHRTMHSSKFTFPDPMCPFCEEEVQSARLDHVDNMELLEDGEDDGNV